MWDGATMPRVPKSARALSRQSANCPCIREAWACVTSGRAAGAAEAICRLRLAFVVKAPDQAVSQSPVHRPVSRGGNSPEEDSRW